MPNYNAPINIQPVQLENPLNNYAKIMAIQNAQNQNALAQQQLEQTQRANAENNALNEQYKVAYDPATGVDYGKVQAGLAAAGHGRLIPGVAKSAAELQKQQTELAVKEQERKKNAISFMHEASTNIVRNPSDQNIVAWLQDAVKERVMTPEQAQQMEKSQLGMTPEQRVAFHTDSGATAKDLIDKKKPHGVDMNDGQFKWVQDTNPFSATYGKDLTPRVKLNATQGELLGAQMQARGQNMTAQTAANRLAFDKNVPEQQAVAAAHATGAETAKNLVTAQAALPGVIANAKLGIQTIDELVGKEGAKGKEGKPAAGFEAAVGATLVPGLKYIPGSSVADFNRRLEQIQGGAFMQAYQTLKGGGQITEVEGAKGTAALNRMATSQSEKEFIKAARDFQSVLRTGVENAEAKAKLPAAANPHASKSNAQILKELGM